MTTTQDVLAALASIEKSTFTPVERDASKAAVGQVVHQGDIYLHRVDANHPRGKPIGTRKLAIGQGEGSNHFAEGAVEVFDGTTLPPWVKVPEWTTAQQLLGPVVVAQAPWRNTHTKHAHNLCAPGVWQVTYQADGLTRRRVAD